ncbi:uncharacterized protein Z518_01994 [Rhinocladiella mackenziei CBS 650.93]|uniref:Rhinocladiella mackenziei CBS 650.93 unplaced genomic scaffold supercont1.2, whole genome shotgun sequence n=1 Tax=Rhinocladiella mackenziei CBS 650.93 TaxID=1442369 RepID=A0A0D2IVU2_9EURO|nr:uncharacterized protein Z518_01994 [Rhinocladiella mackenziei CBS 650.93]KIX07341.1 hypothetical protein Z518_01994 [Rhinocladiella mackenziei CBS 650.93]
MCIAAWQPTWGKILKYFPLNTVFVSSVVGFNIGCVICAVAQNSETLIAGRAVQGALGARLPPGIYTITAFVTPPEQKPLYMGALAAVFGIASVLGPILGGVLTDHATWRLASGGGGPSKGDAQGKISPNGPAGHFRHYGRAVICYLLAMQDGGVIRAWSSARIIGLLIGIGLLSLLFVVIQYVSGDRAVFRGREVKNRTLMVMCLISFFMTAGFRLLLYYLPIYFQSTRDVSAATSVINILPLGLTTSFFAIACGVIMKVWGRYVPVLLIGSLPLTVGAGLLYTLDIDTSTGKLVGFQLLAGTGIGLVFQIPVMVAQSIVEAADMSTVTAIIMWCQTVGAAI